ncbi:MAG: cytosine permease [Firmicutes bacterium]|jgi:NCS1 family nucleobase:cation symporter-1|uniref:Cytosine permease n=1 Tax=Sulfobacillus benefaciens TaxID=453960 RepID=A0A2T2WSF3_9FIRM|nr:cytosine permease [Bacillota bacterium]MCL5015475.1 cytosine permease [Bacillota bacterium]PSR25175.1 MAG: cytosine permease [Sulfobacillus benefaciens]HBQ94449.1 cytosine permease [Sulfobacillus sp.]
MAVTDKASQYGDEVARIEPIGIEHIDEAERHGHVSSIFTLWFGANVELATLTTGTAAVALFGLSFQQAAIGLILGNLLGVILLGLVSTFGPRLGVPQMVHSRASFGFYGNFLPGALNAVAGVMWFAVNTVLGSFAFEILFHTNFLVALVIMALIQVIVAVYGYNMIHAVERFMALILTVIFLGVSVFAFTHANYALPFDAKSPLGQYTGIRGGVIEAVGLALSYLLGWTVFGSDYTRYLPAQTKPSKVFFNAASANFIAGVWLELVGVALATIFPAAAASPNPISLLTGIQPHWMIPVVLFAVLIGTVTANVLNIYSGSLSALVINVPVKRWMAAVLVGILGAILAYVARKSYYLDFENFLFLLAYWLAPWAAVVLVDFFMIRKKHYHTGMFYDPRRFIRPGLWAWMLGIAASVPFFNQALYVGAFAYHHPHMGDISYYVSFVVAGVVYWIFGHRSVKEVQGKTE